MRYYLAYGSNLNMAQMLHRCPTAVVYGTGYIEDYELLYKGSGTGSYLTIEPKKGERVPVAVWKVQEEDEAALDYYEGFPSFYYKKPFKLQTVSLRGRKRTLDAFAYIMHEERKCGIPSSYYVETCENGYADFGFDKRYLDDALRKSEAECIRWSRTAMRRIRRAI